MEIIDIFKLIGILIVVAIIILSLCILQEKLMSEEEKRNYSKSFDDFLNSDRD